MNISSGDPVLNDLATTSTGESLTEIERLCWRTIAEHVSREGCSPSINTLSKIMGRSHSNAASYRLQLVRKGYLAKEGTNLCTEWRVLIWPEGVEPREIATRARRLQEEISPETVATMQRMKDEQKQSVGQIARAMGFSPYRVERVLGLRTTESKPRAATATKRRPCLTCGDPFLSEGAGHRICDECKSRKSWRDGNDFHFPSQFIQRGARA